MTGSSANYSVDGSGGVLKMAPGTSRRALLPSVSTPGAEVTASFGYQGTLSAGSLYVSVLPRTMSSGSAYRAKVVVGASGSARVSLTRVSASGAETTLSTSGTSLAGMGPAKRILVKAQATGASPTTLRAKIWFEGTTEPTNWSVQATDAANDLQGPGGVGIFAYQSSSGTAGVSVRVDNLRALAK